MNTRELLNEFDSEKFDETIAESRPEESIFTIKNIDELTGKPLREIIKLFNGKHVRIGSGTSFFYADAIHAGTRGRISLLSKMYHKKYISELNLAKAQEKKKEENLASLSLKFFPDLSEEERLEKATALIERFNQEGKSRNLLEESLHKLLRTEIKIILPGRRKEDEELTEKEKLEIVNLKELLPYLKKVKKWKEAKKEGTLERDEWGFPYEEVGKYLSIEEYAKIPVEKYDLPPIPEGTLERGFLSEEKVVPAKNWKSAYNKVLSNKKVIEELTEYLDNWKPFLERKVIEAFRSMDPENEILFGKDSVTIFKVEGNEPGKYWYEGEYGKHDPYFPRG